LSIKVFVEKPKSLSFAEAASIPVVYVTAWMLIVHSGGLQKGQTILIHNAGGGVGLAAIDIAKHIGAITIGTASAKKHGLDCYQTRW
jgi:synaptic vesicle membrane protein VAT-1